MSKQKLTVTVLQESPLILSIKKNGRGVHSKVAMDALKKMYPEHTFYFTKGDHQLFAREII